MDVHIGQLRAKIDARLYPGRQAALIFLSAILLCLGLAGCSLPARETPTATPTAFPEVTASPTSTLTATVSPPSPAPTATLTTAAPTPTSAPTPTPCGTVPAGWESYSVQPGNTLFGLAALSGVSQELVMQVNCLVSPDLVVEQRLFLPPLPTPTPTPCLVSPPLGWVLYTIRPGDTLFSLAVTRGTTYEYVMQVNCLDSSNIQVDQGLYLPPLPITYEPPPTSPPGPSPTEEAELPEWELDIGKPGGDIFMACYPDQAFPWVDMLPSVWPPPSDPNHHEIVQLGERRYFFACAFTATAATVKMSDGTSQQITPVTTLSNLDLEMNTATAVIDWPVLPTHPVGRYTVIMTDTNGTTASTSFTVVMPTKARILAVPSANPPGTPFDLYFVNLEQDEVHNFAFCHAAWTKKRSYEPISCDRRAVQMDDLRNDEGEIWWAHESWTAEATDLPAPLAVIAYEDTDRYALFWLR